MITNEKQYRITRNKAKGFAQAIEDFDGAARERLGVDARLVQAELEAMESQLLDLRDELEEYERLKSADLSVISVTSFDNLADGLIKARIAAGLSQRALAQRLELKEQQIQRYEAERYASASYKRMCQVAHALAVRIENEILLPVVPASFEGLLAKVSQVGLSREFVVGRLLSTADAAVAEGGGPGRTERRQAHREGRGRLGTGVRLGPARTSWARRRCRTHGRRRRRHASRCRRVDGRVRRACSLRTRTTWPSSPSGGWATARRRRFRAMRGRCAGKYSRAARDRTTCGQCFTPFGISVWWSCP